MIEYRVLKKEGFTEKVGELVSMLDHARAVTLEEVEALSQEELDYLPDDRSNSIGALLLHIAAIEYVHQVISFENRDLTEEEFGEWGPALELGDRARKTVRNQPISYYVNALAKVRERTYALLKEKHDEWLYEENKWPNDVAYNNYYLWFHVLEDEISHRGQMRIIKRNIRSFH
ncbi:DUF664 domain-containing protein [Halobacillus locisalis]|uniref:DUF664 domain-containing protein n=1 Tax=Halobacillus locisalis TaxID=220753 RepID=A0A838CWR7_9BACI|nr:DinB family protein [Halobacillus locisalis]MBA2176368.1 DUF664 domain-containing protein [Halobacillus locisalis]